MTTKAGAIRRVLSELTEKGLRIQFKDVQRRLAELEPKLKVTPQQVSNEKVKLAKQPSDTLDKRTVSLLKKVKALVDEFGSTDVVRRALDELDDLH